MKVRLQATAILVFLALYMSSDCRAECGPTSTCDVAPPVTIEHPACTGLQGEKVRWELANAAAKLASVEAAVAKASDRADQVARRTTRYSFYTVLGTAMLTAGVTLLAQWLVMRQQLKINRAESEAKVANSYVEWQLQQLSELYGPVRALLGQSNVLYRHMNKALVAADPNRFRLVPGNDFDRFEFQLKIQDNWVRFRTVKHLAEVYNKDYGVEPYFDDVVEVGARLAEVVREKAGYASQDDNELVRVMGEYLAHYLVLKRLHDRAKAGLELHINSADEEAVFPNRIQQLVDNGFASINRQVINWREQKAATS